MCVCKCIQGWTNACLRSEQSGAWIARVCLCVPMCMCLHAEILAWKELGFDGLQAAEGNLTDEPRCSPWPREPVFQTAEAVSP